MWRENLSGEEEREYYFLLFYWVLYKNKNLDVGWVVKWVNKIDKIIFEDAK